MRDIVGLVGNRQDPPERAISDLSTEEFRVYLKCEYCDHITIFKSPWIYPGILDDARKIDCSVCGCCPIALDKMTRMDIDGDEKDLEDEYNHKHCDELEETQQTSDD